MIELPLDLEPIRRRKDALLERYALASFYEDPRMQIPVDIEALIAEVERLRGEAP